MGILDLFSTKEHYKHEGEKYYPKKEGQPLIINFDRDNDYVWYRLAHREFNTSTRKWKLYCYPLDISGMDKQANAIRNTQHTLLAHEHHLHTIGRGDWSPSFDIVLVFPPTPDKLPTWLHNAKTIAGQSFAELLISETARMDVNQSIMQAMGLSDAIKDKLLQKSRDGTLDELSSFAEQFKKIKEPQSDGGNRDEKKPHIPPAQ